MARARGILTRREIDAGRIFFGPRRLHPSPFCSIFLLMSNMFTPDRQDVFDALVRAYIRTFRGSYWMGVADRLDETLRRGFIPDAVLAFDNLARHCAAWRVLSAFEALHGECPLDALLGDDDPRQFFMLPADAEV